MTSLDAQLREELDLLAERGLLREPLCLPEHALVLCSNDYLGYARDPVASLELGNLASGAGASRLISGDHTEHRRAENEIADWLGLDAALLMSSGYAANVGVLSSLPTADDVILSDALNHASIIDGCRLSRATTVVVDHLDLGAMHSALERARDAKRRWVVTESYFSMDGHVPDLRRLRELCDAHDAYLIVDEAHALGVFGPEGAGRCREQSVRPDVLVGTLGKALGLAGAFIAGSDHLRSWLWNRARSFVFSTAIPPWLAEGARRRVVRTRADDAARTRLRQLATRLRAGLPSDVSLDGSHGGSVGPIVPWILGDSRTVVRRRDALLERGVFVQAIRPPTVPDGAARLRITLHAKLSDDELARALAALRDAAGGAHGGAMSRGPAPTS